MHLLQSLALAFNRLTSGRMSAERACQHSSALACVCTMAKLHSAARNQN